MLQVTDKMRFLIRLYNNMCACVCMCAYMYSVLIINISVTCNKLLKKRTVIDVTDVLQILKCVTN